MEEPFYVRQTAEPATVEEQRAWVKACLNEAKADGATWSRVTIHARDARLVLVECWKQRPKDQGKPRFFETMKPASWRPR